MKTGGKSYVSFPPAFSNDGKRLLVCTGNTVSIFSTSTGLQIASLEGDTAPVTSVIVVPASSPATKILCYCWTASLDGFIRYWDFSVPDLMKKVDIKMPIFSMPMTAAAFSCDGSVLAVAAETVITLWDPYSAACAVKLLSFAVLALLPESSIRMEYNGPTYQGRDGIILLFNVMDPIPVASWSVRKAKGGRFAFIQGYASSLKRNNSDGNAPQELLVYINGDHEYSLFDPYGNEANELSMSRQEGLVELEETGKFGYASIYGELPELNSIRNQTSLVPSVPSERPWESIFSGSSHNLPSLTKLCSAFLESLMEKRTAIVE